MRALEVNIVTSKTKKKKKKKKSTSWRWREQPFQRSAFLALVALSLPTVRACVATPSLHFTYIIQAISVLTVTVAGDAMRCSGIKGSGLVEEGRLRAIHVF